MLRPAIVLALFLAAAPAAAQGGGDWYRGAGIALIWCSTCHVIDARGTGPAFSRVPRFPDIARKPGATPDHLRRWLTAEHVRMPRLHLTERDRDDVIAYIRSLAHPRP